MTPKEKAKELFSKYYVDILEVDSQISEEIIISILSKKFALIAVDEMIKILVELSNGEFTFIHNVQYWQEVKQEIEKL